MMVFGFIVHLCGFFCDSGMILRMKVQNKCFGYFALISVSLYTVAFVVWLVMIHVVRYTHPGMVCAGDFLQLHTEL